MSTDVVMFDPNNLALPAHVGAFNEAESNIEEKMSIPMLSFRGKAFRKVVNGIEEVVVNPQGDPVSVIHVLVLDYNKKRSRAYYEGAYEEGKAVPPTCYSSDGETPDASVETPQSATCATCKWSVKGSKITPNGKETTACAVNKRIAVVPLTDLGCEPLLLRIAQTSMWDKNNQENEAKGYYAWDQYLDMLRKHGVNHTGILGTKIKFDVRTAYPKLLFGASRFLTAEELAIAKPLFKDPRVAALLEAGEPTATKSPATPAADDASDAEAAPVAAPVAASTGKVIKPPKAQPAPAPVAAAPEDDDDIPPGATPPTTAEQDDDAPPPAATAAPKAAKAAAKPAAPKAATAPKAAAKPATNGAAGAPAASGLANLVDNWEE